MSLTDYKKSIKEIVDSTDNELLLKYWGKQLKSDLNNLNEEILSDEEWNLVEEGIADYKKRNVMSLEEFINKR